MQRTKKLLAKKQRAKEKATNHPQQPNNPHSTFSLYSRNNGALSLSSWAAPKAPGAAATAVATNTSAMMANANGHCSATVLVRNCPTPNPALRKAVAKPTCQSLKTARKKPAKTRIPQMVTFARTRQPIPRQPTITAPFNRTRKKVKVNGKATTGVWIQRGSVG